MAKRLSDTEKWMDSWFRRLPINSKILWLYMLDRCDIAGVWEIDLDLFNLLTGSAATREEMERDFGDRLHFFDGGRKVWIRRFIDFQNGVLEEDSKSPIIRSILKTLKSHELLLPYFKGINTLSNRDKEKERVKEEEGKGVKGETKRKPDPIFDAIHFHLFAGNPLSKGDGARIGRLAAELRQREATPEQVPEKIEAYRKLHPDWDMTPEAVVKHWPNLKIEKKSHVPSF